MFNLVHGFTSRSRVWIRGPLVMTPNSAVVCGLQIVNRCYSSWFNFDTYL